MNYPFILFDFDGTLVDTAPDLAHHANAVLREYGFPAKPLNEVTRAVGRGVHELLKTLAPGIDEDSRRFEGAVASFRQRYAEHPVIESAPYEGVVEALSGPLARAKKAILTNKPHDITLRIVDELRLGNFFAAILGAGAGYPHKPDPQGARHVLSLLGGTPEGAVLVGDSDIDEVTARASGMAFAWVDYGYDLASGHGIARFSSPREWKILAGEP